MKVGLIGCGGMGNVHNSALKGLSDIMGVEITAIADCMPEALERGISQWPNAKKYEMGMDLIESEDLDLIHICLPSYLHFEHAYAAMEKGIPVFIEKPVCLKEEDGIKLLELQKKTGVQVMVGHVVRCFDEYKFLKECYDKNKFGKLKSIVMRRVGGKPIWGFENWFLDKEKSGSVVLDLHIHDVDFLRYMIGEPTDFKVNHSSFESEMVNHIITMFQFDDIFAHVEALWDSCPELPFQAFYRACFEEATVIYDGIHEPHLAVYPKDGEMFIPELDKEFDKEDQETGINISNLGAYDSEIKYFIECLKGKRTNTLAPLSEGVKSMNLAIKELMIIEKKKGDC